MIPPRTVPPLLPVLALACWPMACGEGGTEPPPPPPDPPRAATVTVTPATASLTALGHTVQLTAQVLDQYGRPMPAAAVAWSSGNAAVATVDASGLVTAVDNGSATITATSASASGSAAVTVDNTDRAALTALYEAADGPNWRDNTNWLTDAPLGEWSGVETDSAGRVVSLEFPRPGAGEGFAEGQRLKGRLPPEIGNLSHLRGLKLPWNLLGGPVPPELGNLSRLRELDLTRNNFSGPLPPKLADLANLEELSFEYNELSGSLPPELGKLANLRSLNLWYNHLSGPLPPELGDLTNLKELQLAGNRFAGAIPQTWLGIPLELFAWGDDGFGNSSPQSLCAPGTPAFAAWLGRMSSLGPFCNDSDRAFLTRLFNTTDGRRWSRSTGWLDGPALENWDGVRADSLGRVTALHLSGNGLSGDLPSGLGSLARATSIRIDGNQSLTGRLPLSVAAVDLDEFHYDDTELCEPADESFRDWLGAIPSLRGTGVGCAPLSDRDALVALHDAAGGPGWSNSDNWLTDAPLRSWYGVEVDSEERVVGLNLDYNGLSGHIPPELGSLANLESLDLSSNRDLTGPIPPALGRLSKLRVLNLAFSYLTGPIPPELGALANLDWLDLQGNRLTGAIPAELGHLMHLRVLNLRVNGLSGAIPPVLGGMSNLVLLELNANKLSGPIPPELSRLSNLWGLILSDNELSGSIPHEFGGMARLSSLKLARNEELAGPLPASLTGLRLESLQAGGTDLCAPSDPSFQAWLASVGDRWIAGCGEAMAYLVQTVQSRTHPVPLVAGEGALLRVFVTAARETAAGIPAARARFYLDGAEQHTVDIPAKSAPIPAEVDEGDRSRSINVAVPGRVMRPGLEMVVEIDPDGTLDEALGVPRRIPEMGRLAVDVREMPVLDMTMVPFLWSQAPDSAVLRAVEDMAADPEGHPLLEETRVLLPVGGIEVTAHEPVVSSSNHSHDLADQAQAIRILEGGGGYYVATMSGETSGFSGVAALENWYNFSILDAAVIAHELGHNMSLGHAPGCRAGGPDTSFPYADGSIGAWGYDHRRDRLVSPALLSDHMTYCDPAWVSDYHFVKPMRWRLANEATSATASAAAPTTSLFLWGGVDLDGEPFLNPAFVADAPAALPRTAGDHTLTGRDADGGELFSLSFAMDEVASPGGTGFAFAFALPVRRSWAGALATVTLSGPDGEVALASDTDRPMAILRDPATGRVRAFLRDPPLAMQAAGDAAGRAVGPGLDVLFSRGIPGPEAWRR